MAAAPPETPGAKMRGSPDEENRSGDDANERDARKEQLGRQHAAAEEHQADKDQEETRDMGPGLGPAQQVAPLPRQEQRERDDEKAVGIVVVARPLPDERRQDVTVKPHDRGHTYERRASVAVHCPTVSARCGSSSPRGDESRQTCSEEHHRRRFGCVHGIAGAYAEKESWADTSAGEFEPITDSKRHSGTLGTSQPAEYQNVSSMCELIREDRGRSAGEHRAPLETRALGEAQRIGVVGARVAGWHVVGLTSGS